MEKVKVAVLGWEPPSWNKVTTGAGMYLCYLAEIGSFSRAHGRKLNLTFIVPSQRDMTVVHRENCNTMHVQTKGFRKDCRYNEDVLYPATERFADRLLGRRSPVNLKKFDMILANSFAFGELIARAKLDNLVYISHRPEFLREKFAKHFGVKVVSKRRLRRDTRLETKAIENSVRTITVSKACRRELTRKFARAHIDVIYNGVDTDLFSRDKCESNGKTVFTYVGRNHPEKGVDLLLQSVRCAIDHGCPEFELRLLTDGGVSLKRAVKRMDLSRWVKLVGWQRPYKLPHYYSSSTFTIMPSYWESFSYATAEGLACEVPAIVSTAGALPEIVNDGIGLCFRAGNERDLTNRLEEACTYDSERVMRMGRRGRKMIKHRFSKGAFLHNYLRYIEGFRERYTPSNVKLSNG